MATDYRRMMNTRGNEADWLVSSRILLAGELGFQIDPSGWRAKVGDGTTAWADLPWFGETDSTARASIVSLTATLNALDVRVEALEAEVDVAALSAQVDALSTSMENKQEKLGDDAELGDIAFHDGTVWRGLGLTLTPAAMLFWNASTEEYEATGTGTAGQHLAVGDDGKPAWTLTYRAADGSAGVPSMSFKEDPDTGVYRPAANSYGIAAGGVQRVQIDTRFLHQVAGDSLNGTTTIRFDKNEAGEVIVQAHALEDSGTHHVLNLNKSGGTVLINDAAVASSLALKRDVKEIRAGIDALNQINVIQFRRRDRNDRRLELGFAAEQVAEVLPDAVSRHPNGDPSGVFFADMLALVAKSVQELSSRLDRLEETLAARD